eukprot:908846-Rhodomonas_salina.3
MTRTAHGAAGSAWAYEAPLSHSGSTIRCVSAAHRVARCTVRHHSISAYRLHRQQRSTVHHVITGCSVAHSAKVAGLT